jgi:hypothetical protein
MTAARNWWDDESLWQPAGTVQARGSHGASPSKAPSKALAANEWWKDPELYKQPIEGPVEGTLRAIGDRASSALQEFAGRRSGHTGRTGKVEQRPDRIFSDEEPAEAPRAASSVVGDGGLRLKIARGLVGRIAENDREMSRVMVAAQRQGVRPQAILDNIARKRADELEELDWSQFDPAGILDEGDAANRYLAAKEGKSIPGSRYRDEDAWLARNFDVRDLHAAAKRLGPVIGEHVDGVRPSQVLTKIRELHYPELTPERFATALGARRNRDQMQVAPP